MWSSGRRSAQPDSEIGIYTLDLYSREKKGLAKVTYISSVMIDPMKGSSSRPKDGGGQAPI